MAGALKAYVKRGHRKVRGWLNPIAIDIICELSNLQRQLGIRGSACEIGVHHGRLFILLHLLTAEDEKSVAYDLFEKQDENVDKSGHGDKMIFIKNLKRHHCDLSRITINTENSINLTSERIMNDCGGRIRIFSIDGGHTPEITYNDLSLASKTLCDGGLIILDDFFNEAWPGVAEGASKYLINNNDIIPVTIAGNKFIFSNNRILADSYIKGFTEQKRKYKFKKQVIFDNETLIIIPFKRANFKNSIRDILVSSYLWKSIRDKPIGRFIKRAVRSISF